MQHRELFFVVVVFVCVCVFVFNLTAVFLKVLSQRSENGKKKKTGGLILSLSLFYHSCMVIY